jgi:iron-sulfur cluster insertion protein
MADPIQLTSSAAQRVATIAAKQGKPAILRLSVETDGVKLVVDSVSLDLVRGCAVDYVENLGGAAFKVENPNAASGCGCGSSFSI